MQVEGRRWAKAAQTEHTHFVRVAGIPGSQLLSVLFLFVDRNKTMCFTLPSVIKAGRIWVLKRKIVRRLHQSCHPHSYNAYLARRRKSTNKSAKDMLNITGSMHTISTITMKIISGYNSVTRNIRPNGGSS